MLFLSFPNYLHNYARFEVFMAVKIQVEVLWVVTPCSVVVGYHCFRGPCCHHLQSEVSGAWLGIQVVIFWFVTPCGGVVGYQHFGVPCCLHLCPTLLHGVTTQMYFHCHENSNLMKSNPSNTFTM